VDAGGRILLPKKVRQRLGLAAGDELAVEFPVTGLPLRREGKFWVYRGGDASGPTDVAALVAAEREARSESILPGSTALPSIEEAPEA
jgi:bifunctional DNA-binding transcriptional regulator/antitoxin component of YhaV-PrlF toxin-antitoxin module